MLIGGGGSIGTSARWIAVRTDAGPVAAQTDGFSGRHLAALHLSDASAQGLI
jgi:hypothetical protein